LGSHPLQAGAHLPFSMGGHPGGRGGRPEPSTIRWRLVDPASTDLEE